MAIWEAVKRQLRSIIEWRDPVENELFYQWSDNGDEIKNASKLIIGPGQGCIFVYQGEVQAVILKEGIVDVLTQNIPFWTTIKKFMQAFESEHKVGIYFFKKTRVLDQKWGTTSPIKYEDPKYQFPVALRTYGNYSFKITNPGDFFTTVVGANNHYYLDDFRQMINARIVQPLSDFFAEARYSYTDIDANREELAKGIANELQVIFASLGFVMTDFRIEGTSFDAATIQRINRIADITAETHAANTAGLNYAQLQQLEAMQDAANNAGGGAGIGMGIGAGMGFGQMMAESMPKITAQTTLNHAKLDSDAPNHDPIAKLTLLKELLQKGLITETEFNTKKQQILDDI